MISQPPPTDETSDVFTVEDGYLVRRVVPRRGTPYEHRCPLDAFEAVAHEIDAMRPERFCLDDLQRRTGLPHSQVNVAFAFLKERGSVVPSGRAKKHAAAAVDVYLDAMTEYHALREGDQDD